jgi:hypothetical protein
MLQLLMPSDSGARQFLMSCSGSVAARIRIRGINDVHDTCSHCGKTGLKRVVWC